MQASSVQIPKSLLCNPDISSSAKVVWMVLRLEGGAGTQPPGHVSISRLASRAGISRPTVYKAIRELSAARLLPNSPTDRTDPADSRDLTETTNRARSIDQTDSTGRTTREVRSAREVRVQLPIPLVVDKELSANTKVFYGKLKLKQRELRRHSTGPTLQFTYSFLATLTHLHRKTVAKAVRALVNAGWLSVERRNNKLPAKCLFKDPRLSNSESEVKKVSRRLDKAPFRGEALMREFLSLLIDSEEYEDNASPGFLVNPLTDERLQLDRYYPPSVAFEYNGPQHYGPTDQYSAQDAVNQRTRDLIKIGLCAIRGITLRIVHAQDLTLSKMKEKVGHLLPLRDLSHEGPRIAFLQSVAKSYRRRALSNPFHTPRQ